MSHSGESLKKGGFLSEDRISELPEALLLQILSSLPTKTVIATSVLSKRWRSLWKEVPKLAFESYGNTQEFAENIGRFLLLHKAPVLESLHLNIGNHCDAVYIGIWSGIAFARHVRELVLDLDFPRGQPVKLPSSLFCFDTLETLKLKGYVFLDVPSPVSMKSLRTLHLQSVVYKDDESVRNLFTSCPNLENLVVHRGKANNYVVNFIIDAPSLKTLSLYDPTSGKKNGGYVINAPSMKYLEIERLKGYEFCVIENASELVEANIRNVSCVVNEKIMGSLKSAKLLSLDLSPLQHFLDLNKQFMDDGKWTQPKYVPECLLSHLEIFVWTRYDWERKEEKEVATYILRYARRLKKATFSTRPIEPNKRLEILDELNGVVKASNSCHLVFE